MNEAQQNSAPRVLIAVSAYSRSITDRLLEGALATFGSRFPGAPEPEVHWAPGSFELVSIAAAAHGSGRFDAVVTLGCIIRGETDHDRYIAQSIANSIADLNTKPGAVVSFGVITANTREQAEARAGGEHGNKGEEAMLAALEAHAACVAIGAGLSSGPSAVITDKGTA